VLLNTGVSIVGLPGGAWRNDDVGRRWNGDQMKDDPSMNSYNHYAYGAVVDWIYRYAAGVDANHRWTRDFTRWCCIRVSMQGWAASL